MKKVGIFYGPQGGNTEVVAKKIAAAFEGFLVDLVFVNQAKVESLADYDLLVLGTATVGNDSWDGKHPRNGWDLFFPKLINSDLKGKKIALFGLGNQMMYPRNFVDAIGFFGKALEEKGVVLIGKTDTYGYSFEESSAHIGDSFIGLPIDHDTEEHLTDERVEKWVSSIKKELAW